MSQDMRDFEAELAALINDPQRIDGMKIGEWIRARMRDAANEARFTRPSPSGRTREIVERIKAVTDAWSRHAKATERTNAAIPDLEATRAERAVYDERYRASEQCKRDMYGAAFEFAKWCAETEAATLIESLSSTIAEARAVIETAFKEAYQLGFLEGYECEPRYTLDEEGRVAALKLCDGTSEAWSDYRAASLWLTRNMEGEE